MYITCKWWVPSFPCRGPDSRVSWRDPFSVSFGKYWYIGPRGARQFPQYRARNSLATSRTSGTTCWRSRPRLSCECNQISRSPRDMGTSQEWCRSVSTPCHPRSRTALVSAYSTIPYISAGATRKYWRWPSNTARPNTETLVWPYLARETLRPIWNLIEAS